MSGSGAPPAQKGLEEYEYRVRVHEVDPDTGEVTLLFEEVDGLDGFAVTLGRDELAQLMQSGGFDDWAEEQVARRIELLKQVRQREDKKKAAMDEIKGIKERLEKKRVFPKKRKSGGVRRRRGEGT